MKRFPRTEAFVFKRDWTHVLKRLSDEDQLSFYRAITAYAFGEPHQQYLTTNTLDVLFTLVSAHIDSSLHEQHLVFPPKPFKDRQIPQ